MEAPDRKTNTVTRSSLAKLRSTLAETLPADTASIQLFFSTSTGYAADFPAFDKSSFPIQNLYAQIIHPLLTLWENTGKKQFAGKRERKRR